MATRPFWIIGDEEEDLYASACARGADSVGRLKEWFKSFCLKRLKVKEFKFFHVFKTSFSN
jgi:hypothetical protein